MICALCRQRINRRRRWPDPLAPVRDHIRQRHLGGADTRENLRVVHHGCNQRRTRGGRDAGLCARTLVGYTREDHGSFSYYIPV